MTTQKPELMPCPFCGAQDIFVREKPNNSDAECHQCGADVPSLRHCEAANRETVTQPPQATDAQRRAALKDINDFMASGDETDWQDVFDIFARHKDTIRAALDRIEAVEKSADLWICHRGVSEPKHDGDTGYEYFEPVRPYKEAVETVTPDELMDRIEYSHYNYLCMVEEIANKFPNGLRIVKEK